MVTSTISNSSYAKQIDHLAKESEREIKHGLESGKISQPEAEKLRTDVRALKTQASKPTGSDLSEGEFGELAKKFKEVKKSIGDEADNTALDYGQRYAFVTDMVNGLPKGEGRDALNQEVEILRAEYHAHSDQIEPGGLLYDPSVAKDFSARVNALVEKIGAETAKNGEDPISLFRETSTNKTERLTELVDGGIADGLIDQKTAEALKARIAEVSTRLNQDAGFKPGQKTKIENQLRSLLKEIHEARAQNVPEHQRQLNTIKGDFETALKLGTLSKTEQSALQLEMQALEEDVAIINATVGPIADNVRADFDQRFKSLSASLYNKATDNKTDTVERLKELTNRLADEVRKGSITYAEAAGLEQQLNEIGLALASDEVAHDDERLTRAVDDLSQRIVDLSKNDEVSTLKQFLFNVRNQQLA